MQMKRLRNFGVALVAAVMPAIAQTTSGSISGTIVDASHAVVANATVAAIELDKNLH